MKTLNLNVATCNSTTTEKAPENNVIKFDLQVIAYSDKSFVVTGDYTKQCINELKEIGGKFNARLDSNRVKSGCGWVFKAEDANKLRYFIALQRLTFFDSQLTALLDDVKPVLNLGNSTQRANFLKPFFLIDSAIKEYQNAFNTVI